MTPLDGEGMNPSDAAIGRDSARDQPRCIAIADEFASTGMTHARRASEVESSSARRLGGGREGEAYSRICSASSGGQPALDELDRPVQVDVVAGRRARGRTTMS